MGKSVFNKGIRTYLLRREDHPEAPVRELPPGQSIETLDDKEHARMIAYHDIVDGEKVAPQHTEEIAKLKAKIAELESKNVAATMAADLQPIEKKEQVEDAQKKALHQSREEAKEKHAEDKHAAHHKK